MKKRLREYQQMVSDNGGTVVSVVQNKHYKIKVRACDGRERTFTTSVTPSDVRTDLNILSRLRRFLIH